MIGFCIGLVGGIILALGGGPAAAERQHPSGDARQRLVLPAAQRDQVLTEMRLMLGSVSGILQNLAAGDLLAGEKAARASGIAVAADVDPRIEQHLPQPFLELGVKTHNGFDSLADRMKAGASRDDVIRELAGITGNCVACHAIYRLDESR
jgi:hypothetical protein